MEYEVVGEVKGNRQKRGSRVTGEAGVQLRQTFVDITFGRDMLKC